LYKEEGREGARRRVRQKTKPFDLIF